MARLITLWLDACALRFILCDRALVQDSFFVCGRYFSFSQDRAPIVQANNLLRNASGVSSDLQKRGFETSCCWHSYFSIISFFSSRCSTSTSKPLSFSLSFDTPLILYFPSCSPPNSKSTGAVVGQQPFGGARGSGTNDKAGSISIFYRFVQARSIKETFLPPREYAYPSNFSE